ncbi:hypothetical protein KRR26_04725 [Corallococcus sp. M34]|uniref:MXAN_2561 family MXYO-CTERM-anchored protein n=1 Tax=Citreicoccus inhibens TaxID=2849499 RepID=UPI0011C36442|nr:hypothetical protein [Citreicoccus inhibens]
MLCASTAFAQAVTFTVTSTNGTDVLVPKDNCETSRQVSYSRSGGSCDVITLWVASGGSCSSNNSQPSTADLILKEIPTSDTTTVSGTLNFSVSQVLAKLAVPTDGAPPISCSNDQGIERNFKVCATTRKFSTSGVGTTSCDTVFSSIGNPINVKYDPQAPDAPVITGVTPRDSALAVSVNAETDSTITVTAVPQEAQPVTDAGSDAGVADGGQTDGGDAGQAGVGARPRIVTAQIVTAMQRTGTKVEGEGAVIIDGLTNDVTYVLTATATDRAGNTSPASATALGTPVASLGLSDAYASAGGHETGGCGATGGGLAGGAVMAALGFWLSSRRKVS